MPPAGRMWGWSLLSLLDRGGPSRSASSGPPWPSTRHGRVAGLRPCGCSIWTTAQPLRAWARTGFRYGTRARRHPPRSAAGTGLSVFTAAELGCLRHQTTPGPHRHRHILRAGVVLSVKGDVMTTSILVTDGTGTLGRPVARRLREAGAGVTVLSRHPRETADGIRDTAGDLSTGDGIEAAARKYPTV